MTTGTSSFLGPPTQPTSALSASDLDDLLNRRAAERPHSEHPIFGKRSQAALFDLSGVLTDDASFASFAEQLEETSDSQDNWGAARRAAADAGVTSIVGIAAAFLIAERNTSGASASEFGLALSLSASQTYGVNLNGAMNDIPAEVANAARQLVAKYAGPLSRFLQAQHELSSALLVGHSSAILFRGERRHESPESPEERRPVRLRPLSSWTTDETIAHGMTGAMDAGDGGAHVWIMVAEVPVDRILATWVTGFGSPWEKEVVLLGGYEGDTCAIHA